MTATEPRSAVAPPRRNRRTARRPGAGARILGVVIGMVLLAGAMGMQSLKMSEGELGDPIAYSGEQGQNVDTRRFTLRLDSFGAAKSVETTTETISTDNLFLIVNASAKSSRKPYHLGQPVLETADGKRFHATDRIDNSLTLGNAWVQPDIWVSGPFYFEVPVSALPGAEVVFGLPPVAGPVEPYQPEVEVDLGLDEEGARKLAASAKDVFSAVRK
ncbi:hypothetical protein ABGB18_43175 [Nonomuraea sp. B12E4]|uniref:hypothetical protein n=1 Tax=Nonomuraea sp. B12E4 TaxID=3153564 RepID=UPI00325C998D